MTKEQGDVAISEEYLDEDIVSLLNGTQEGKKNVGDNVVATVLKNGIV